MKPLVKITWLDDYYDCEQCGGAGASGATVELNGKVILDMSPQAHCFGGISYSENQVFIALIKALGYDYVEGDSGSIWGDNDDLEEE